MRLILVNRADLNPDLLLDEFEVAALLNCSVKTLKAGRPEGRVKDRQLNLPPHLVIFGRMVRYRYGDLVTWVAQGGRERQAA